MCNAWNHSLGCTCGWGGDGHMGRRGAGDSNLQASPNVYLTHHGYYDYASYVNPNAICPMCGAQVFFYQSPDGGRVFFDDLGPPWPKHPCTDLSLRPVGDSRNSHPVTGTGQSAVQRKYSWQKEGWKPFICLRVVQVQPDCRVCRLLGHFNNSEATLYVPLPSLSSSALYQVRPDKQPGVFQVSVMQFSSGSQSKEVSTFAFLRMPDAYAYRKTLKFVRKVSVVRKNHEPRSANNRTKDNKQSDRRVEAKGPKPEKTPRSPTAIELAFAQARNKQDE